MTPEEKELAKRFEELSDRAERRGIYTNTPFLTTAEQAVLAELGLPFSAFGGYEEAERIVALFGHRQDCGYPPQNPIALLQVKPKSERFADALTHRDYLGAIMNLGIKRETVGDIVASEKEGYVVCLETVADYLVEQLTQIRHTAVTVKRTEKIPPLVLPQPQSEQIVISSARLDAVISAVWDLSRAEGKRLVEREQVTLSGKLCTDPGKELIGGERISVRGYGRFYYDGIDRETKKGKLRADVRIFH